MGDFGPQGAYVQRAYVWRLTSGGICQGGLCPGLLLWWLRFGGYASLVRGLCPGGGLCQGAYVWQLIVESYLYPTVGTVLIHSVKPELTE